MLTINATLVAIVINFLILVYVLNYFLYKPVMQVLSQRKMHVDTALSEADAKLISAKAFMEESTESINKANISAKGIIDQASLAAEKIRKEELADAKSEIEEMKDRAKAEIKQYREAAKSSIVSEAARLSVVIAEKIILKKIDRKTQKSVVDKFMERMGTK